MIKETLPIRGHSLEPVFASPHRGIFPTNVDRPPSCRVTRPGTGPSQKASQDEFLSTRVLRNPCLILLLQCLHSRRRIVTFAPPVPLRGLGMSTLAPRVGVRPDCRAPRQVSKETQVTCLFDLHVRNVTGNHCCHDMRHCRESTGPIQILLKLLPGVAGVRQVLNIMIYLMSVVRHQVQDPSRVRDLYVLEVPLTHLKGSASSTELAPESGVRIIVLPF